MTEQEIKDICEKYRIRNYTINPDGSIDVDGDVNLSAFNFISSDIWINIPIRFNKVSGYFDCSYNELTSLEGCPKYVGGNFNCTGNELISLKRCPKFVGRNFYCSLNPLESLDGYEGVYNVLIYNNLDNRDLLILKHKRSKKLKLIETL